MSCDFLETETPGQHYKGDVRDVLDYPWDLMIAFPPCTHLAASGAQYWHRKTSEQTEAIEFVKMLWGASKRIALENPVGILSTKWRKPDQIIQPYQFGDPVQKKTCLWIKGLPLLRPTNIVEPKFTQGTNSYRGGPRKDGSRRRCTLKLKYSDGKRRSLTQPGIAEAMATQWGG